MPETTNENIHISAGQPAASNTPIKITVGESAENEVLRRPQAILDDIRARRVMAAMPTPEEIMREARCAANNAEVDRKKAEKRAKQEARRSKGIDYRHPRKRGGK